MNQQPELVLQQPEPSPQKPELFLLEWQTWNSNLSAQPELQSRLGNGLTNRSYLLNSNLGKLVLRINRPESEKLGISRKREALILAQLNQMRGPAIAPEVIYQDKQHRYLVYRFIEGDVWSETDVKDPDNLLRIKAVIDQYQRIDIELEPRDYHQYLINYWQQLERQNRIDSTLEKDWLDFQPGLERLAMQKNKARLSHHDLIASNIVETDSGIRIIDWEYAHLGHPDLDLACINGTSDSQDKDLGNLIYWLNELWHRVSKLC